jgi:hypothetical protein
VNPDNPVHPVFRVTLAVLLTLWVATAAAEQKQDFGSYVAHYSAQNTTALSPEIARRHGIARDPRLAMVMVTVQDRAGAAVAASVTGEARNLLGQTQPLEMREVREDVTVYYLGLFSISNMETQTFDLAIRPAGAEQSYRLRFSQQFFVD